MGQMKKLWEEQRDFGLEEESGVDFDMLALNHNQFQQEHGVNLRTLRPSESTDKWRKLEELKESKDEWHLWD